jgi:hypothetical protein
MINYCSNIPLIPIFPFRVTIYLTFIKTLIFYLLIRMDDTGPCRPPPVAKVIDDVLQFFNGALVVGTGGIMGGIFFFSL